MTFLSEFYQNLLVFQHDLRIDECAPDSFIWQNRVRHEYSYTKVLMIVYSVHLCDRQYMMGIVASDNFLTKKIGTIHTKVSKELCTMICTEHFFKLFCLFLELSFWLHFYYYFYKCDKMKGKVEKK